MLDARKSCLWSWTFVFVFALASTRAWSAPIDITARLDPGQSGPVYSWSLLIRVDPGYDVGAVDILTRGFDSFTPNAAKPASACSTPPIRRIRSGTAGTRSS
jgi:hypothetical protein